MIQRLKTLFRRQGSHPIANAITEGLNSKIQAVKSNACGFRSFQNYRTRILFFRGKHNLHSL